MQWNPNAPAVIGPEFPPKSGLTLPGYRIDAPIRVAAQRIDSTVTETVSTLGAFVNMDSASGRFMAETLLAGQEVPTVTTTIVRPNALPNFSATNWDGSGTGANLLASLAQTTPDPTVYVYKSSNGLDTFQLRLQFATAGLFTGERIVAVRLIVVGQDMIPLVPPPQVFVVTSPFTTTIGLWSAGTGVIVAPPGATVNTSNPSFPSSTGPSTKAINMGEINPMPASAQPWTVTNVQEFDSGVIDVDIRMSVNVGGAGTAKEYVRVHQVYLEVDHCPENRVSAQIVTPGVTGARWATFTPRKVDGTANLAKVNGTDLTLLLRNVRWGDLSPLGFGVAVGFSVPYIEGFTDAPDPGLDQYGNAALNFDGTVSELGTPTQRRVIGMEMQVAGTQSVDAQPYIAATPVTITGTIQQEVSQATATNPYGGVIIPARYTLAAGVVGNLVVTLKRRSDNAVMGTATITKALADTFAADPVAGWRLIIAPFAANATLAAATQYYLDLTNSGTGTWEVPALSGVPALGSPVTGVASYRGTTDVATYLGADVNAADFPILVYTSFAAPTGFAASALSTATAGYGPDCGVTAIGYNRLTWTPSVGGGFAYYEIQRNDGLTDWHTVAQITTIGVGTFGDYEARIGKQSCYRLRTVATTGLVSAWSSTVCATRGAFGCGLTFTANSFAEVSVAYPDVYDGTGHADRDYDFPEVDEVDDRTLHGRDGTIAFFPAERRYDRFARRLKVSSIINTGTPAPRQADVLRTLSRAALPYVCVCDEDGGRWFANVKVKSATDRRPGRFEFVDVEIHELTMLPFPIDVAP